MELQPSGLAKWHKLLFHFVPESLPFSTIATISLYST